MPNRYGVKALYSARVSPPSVILKPVGATMSGAALAAAGGRRDSAPGSGGGSEARASGAATSPTSDRSDDERMVISGQRCARDGGARLTSRSAPAVCQGVLA